MAAYRRNRRGVVFGGFSTAQAPHSPETALHRAMSAGSDCAPAAIRSLAPEKHVFTSNLLVRRAVFEAEAFDEGFTGWGWEDVEWAVRVSRRHAIAHVDNTATHLGLDTAPALVGKFEQSTANFARMARLHRDVVALYPGHRAARMLRRLPLARRLAPAEAPGSDRPAPMSLRTTACALQGGALRRRRDRRRLSVLIPTLRRPESLGGRCARCSSQLNLAGLAREIVFVDNAPEGSARAMV